MNYFKDDELRCPCCGILHFSDTALARLNNAREIAGVPFVINSACRCEKHNKEVGGKPSSSHVATEDIVSDAVDIATPDSRTRSKVLFGLVSAGFTRIGIGKNFIHADDDTIKPADVCWLYS